jgi:hypothetical protein
MDPEALADQVLPIGGPYTPGQVHGAAELLAELVRRLNHATRHDDALPAVRDVERLIALLEATAGSLPQLCRQLITRVRSERLGVDGGGLQAVTDTATALTAADVHLVSAALALDRAHQAAARM